MEFTHEQISEIISEITNGEQGLQGLGKQGFESLMLSERSLHNCSHQDVSNGYRDRRVCHEAQTLSHHSTLDDHNNRRQINNEINLELFCRYLFVFGDRNWRPGRFCRSSGFFYHWPAELLTTFVRHHRSGVQKNQKDTRQSSNGRQSRSPSTYVITDLQTGLDLRNNILPGNNPDGLASCYCKFPVVFSLPVSSDVRWRGDTGSSWE